MKGRKWGVLLAAAWLLGSLGNSVKANEPTISAQFPYPNGFGPMSADEVLANPEFFGGSKLQQMANGEYVDPGAVGPNGTGGHMYVSIDAGHGVTFGSDCTGGRAAHANQLATGSHGVGKILISLHFTKGRATDSGPFVVINRVGTGTSQSHQDKSRQVGTSICNRLLTTRFGSGHGKTCFVDAAGDWTVLREVKDTIPAVIVELLNFSNTSDMTWLGTGSARNAKLDQLAEAIYQGIRDYYNAT